MQHSVQTYLFHYNDDKNLPHTLSLMAYSVLKKLSVPVKIEISKDMDHLIDIKRLKDFIFIS